MISLKKLANKLKRESEVAIICHVRPDGDTLGSGLALKTALISLGIKVEVVCDDPVPSRFFFLKEFETVKNVLQSNCSALIAIDCADVTRLGSFANTFLEHKNTYVIDHHISNPNYAKINYVSEEASNSENVFKLLGELQVEITPTIANLLATGVMTDTGAFRHKNVTAQTLSVASELVSRGADLNSIYYHMFVKQSAERAKLFGIIASKIRYFYDKKIAIVAITLNDLAVSGAKPDETEGFIDFVMGIDGVEIGAAILQIAQNKCKVSLRSKSADVSAVAGTFGGGGHVLASGCQIQGEIEEVIDKISFTASRYLPE